MNESTGMFDLVETVCATPLSVKLVSSENNTFKTRWGWYLWGLTNQMPRPNMRKNMAQREILRPNKRSARRHRLWIRVFAQNSFKYSVLRMADEHNMEEVVQWCSRHGFSTMLSSFDDTGTRMLSKTCKLKRSGTLQSKSYIWMNLSCGCWTGGMLTWFRFPIPKSADFEETEFLIEKNLDFKFYLESRFRTGSCYGLGCLLYQILVHLDSTRCWILAVCM